MNENVNIHSDTSSHGDHRRPSSTTGEAEDQLIGGFNSLTI